mgnify:CR=1 FL=1
MRLGQLLVVALTFPVLRLLALLGLVRELHGVPAHIRAGTRRDRTTATAAAPVAPESTGDLPTRA